MNELTELTAREAVARLKAGEVSPLELIDAAQARIAETDDRINAFVRLMRQSALEEAAAAELRAQAGERRGPLDGIGIAVKDLYARMQPDIVVHMAAEVGGIGANMENPGRFFYGNMAMALHMIEHARINGIRTKRILAFTFGISSVIGAVAAMLVAPITTLDPTLMWDPLLKGFAAAVLGGMTSLPGAALGGYLLVIIENLFGAYVSLEFKSVVAFLLIIVVLWFRPSGLFARHYVRKV